MSSSLLIQGGRRHWAAYYTSPQSLIIMFLLAKQPWGLLFNFDWLVHLVECPIVLTTNLNV